MNHNEWKQATLWIILLFASLALIAPFEIGLFMLLVAVSLYLYILWH